MLDASFLLGLGLGWATVALLVLAWTPGTLTDYQLELRARELGMVYAHEVLPFREGPAGHGQGQEQEEGEEVPNDEM